VTTNPTFQLIPNYQPDYRKNCPSKHIRSTIHLVTCNALQLLHEDYTANTHLHIVPKYVFTKLIEDSVKIWGHWKKGTVQFDPKPCFETIRDRLQRMICPNTHEEKQMIQAEIHRKLDEKFRKDILEHNHENPYSSAFSSNLEQGILLLVAIHQGWIKAFVVKKWAFSQRKLNFLKIKGKEK